MSEITKVLTTIGARGSGKTTITLQIANELEKLGNKVVIVSFDKISPLSTIKDNYIDYSISLGEILTTDDIITQKTLYNSMIPLTNNISLITYIYGDVKDKYPKIIANRVRDFINILSSIDIDYIIIDGESNILNVETKTAITLTDRIINIIEANYKSVAYNETYNLMLDRVDIDKNKVLFIVNKINYDIDYNKYILEMNLKYHKELPYLEEIRLNENTPLKELRNKKNHYTEKYKRNLKDIIQTLFNIKYENNNLEQVIEVKEMEAPIIETEESKKMKERIKALNDNFNNNVELENKEKEETTKKKKGLFDFLKKI